jgi:hypothetical protein
MRQDSCLDAFLSTARTLSKKRLMDPSSHDHELTSAAEPWRPAFAVTIAVVILFLSFLYAVTFSQMIHHSVMEQFIAPDPNPPRYVGHTHYHNQVEWFLLIVPALIGWVGAAGSAVYLARRWIGK